MDILSKNVMDKVDNIDMESNNDFTIPNCNVIQIFVLYYINKLEKLKKNKKKTTIKTIHY